MTRGQLRNHTTVHWETMRNCFVRQTITPTDNDGYTLVGADVVDTTYQVDIDGERFVGFEFKHNEATYDALNGQIRSIEALIVNRFTSADRFIWVHHDAEFVDGEAHIRSENITTWKAYVCGDDYLTRIPDEVGTGFDSFRLR